ncbi:DNA adenine methylase [Aerococcus urinaeequi]|uniref:DNA adenine methylase n=1 Tax=Aerococcus urinaeequi TaxID=51665 RepID=UPI0039BC932B
MPVTKSPLRYPGGKTQLSKFVDNLFQINGLNKPIYCEPFSGGFGAGMELLFSGNVESVIINDFDLGIYSIWFAILNESDTLSELITKTPITIQEWEYQKEVYRLSMEANSYSIELAFATLFLNRTNISGIITGGPIGGKSQESKYLIDCRFNKQSLIKKIKNINAYSKNIELYNLEANDLIKNVLLEIDPDNLFIFFDPPYYKQGKNLYTNFFNHEDHIDLKNNIQMLDNFNWITTYDYDANIREIYSDYDSLEYKIRYSANRVRKEKEFLFHSPITKVESFDKVEFQ